MDEENKVLDEIFNILINQFGYKIDKSNVTLKDELLKIINGYRITIESSDHIITFPFKIGGITVNNRSELRVLNATLRLIGGKNNVQF